MKCPSCNVDLLLGERLTVQIDYCPQCRGIWLDRGKLDKIIDHSTSSMQRGDDRYMQRKGYRRDDDDDDDNNNSIMGRLGRLFD